MLSIVNCDRSNFGYYASKAAKEQVYERSGLETVVLRATQFHSLLAMMFGAGSKLRIIPRVKGARFQPMRRPTSPRPCLRPRWNRAGRSGRHRVLTIGGPEIQGMEDLPGSGSAPRARRSPGAAAAARRMGSYLRAGLNLVPEERHAGETFRLAGKERG